MKKRKTISVSLSFDLITRLARLANKNQESRSNLIEELLKKAIDVENENTK